MFHFSRTSRLLILPAAAATIAGCGSSPSQSAAPRAASSAGTVSSAGVPTASQLRSALLGRVNGVQPAVPVQAGSYSALEQVRATNESMRGIKVIPTRCARTTVNGFNSSRFAKAPAAVVTFRLGRDGVSEVLAAPTRTAAATALESQVPLGCDHYRAVAGGKTFKYTVRQFNVPGIGQQARALGIKAAGYSAINVWSLIFRGDKFVGAVTVLGPDASELAVRELGTQSYSLASRTLG